MMRPTKQYEEIKSLLGQSAHAFEKLVGYIRYYYEIDEIWAPGNPKHKYHNTLTFKRGGKSLITLGLREGYFIACIVLGKAERDKFDAQRHDFNKAVCKLYDETEILHDGKWLAWDVRDDSLNDDFVRLLQIKRKPNRKIQPPLNCLDTCRRLDIGLSHQEITAFLFR